VSLRPQKPLPPVPADTARIARAAFPRGNPYLVLRDRLGAVFADADVADLCPRLGQPAYAPWRLALVRLLQCRAGLSERQAAEAVRSRIDWKYLLALDLADAGFDYSVLCEFRGRLLGGDAADRLLARLLDAAREGGLLKARGRQRTDSPQVLAAIRTLTRVERVAGTLRAALNAIAVAAPEWLRGLAPAGWHARYDRRIEDTHLPDTGPNRDAYVAQVGADGFLLLDALDAERAPREAATQSEVAVLRRVWARHFERIEAPTGGGGRNSARLRPAQGRGPGDRVASPDDIDARFRSKAGKSWTGYMVHLTETCDANAPHLIVNADTTPANVHEAPRTAPIHDALAANGLAPSEHLVDPPTSARLSLSRRASAMASTSSVPGDRT
jgi:transposase